MSVIPRLSASSRMRPLAFMGFVSTLRPIIVVPPCGGW
jgi:hypothetical protein